MKISLQTFIIVALERLVLNRPGWHYAVTLIIEKLRSAQEISEADRQMIALALLYVIVQDGEATAEQACEAAKAVAAENHLAYFSVQFLQWNPEKPR